MQQFVSKFADASCIDSAGTGTIDHYNDDIIYKDYRGASFCAFCTGNTDESAKPGFGGACFISDTVYHVTGYHTDQYGLCAAV